MTKHIVMIKRGAGPDGVLRPGKVYAVDDDLAEALVNPQKADPTSDYLPFARYAKQDEISKGAAEYGQLEAAAMASARKRNRA